LATGIGRASIGRAIGGLGRAGRGRTHGTAPRARAHTFAALRHRNFRLFWFGQIISVTGTWMQSVGQAWLVLQLTHNALLLGAVSALQFLPVLCLSLAGGAVADKLPKRAILLGTQSAAMLQAGVMFALSASGAIRVWQVMILATCLGLVNALDIPTRQAFISEMVGREDLMNAISLNSAQFNAARVVGPGVAGALIALLGIPPLFLLNAISYLAVLAGLALMDPARLHAPPAAAGPRQRPLRQIGEGVAFAWRTPPIRVALLTLFLISTFGMNFNVILPLLADTVYHTGAPGFGLLSSFLGLGSLVAALVLATAVRRPRIGLLVGSAAAFGLIELLLAGTPGAGMALVVLLALGFASISFSATANTTLQTSAPDHMRGRVMSLFAMVFAGATPIGALVAGAAAHQWGARVALVVGALPCLAAALYAWSARRAAAAALARSWADSAAPRPAPAVPGAPVAPAAAAAPAEPALPAIADTPAPATAGA
jgi:MFS family permease